MLCPISPSAHQNLSDFCLTFPNTSFFSFLDLSPSFTKPKCVRVWWVQRKVSAEATDWNQGHEGFSLLKGRLQWELGQLKGRFRLGGNLSVQDRNEKHQKTPQNLWGSGLLWTPLPCLCYKYASSLGECNGIAPALGSPRLISKNESCWTTGPWFRKPGTGGPTCKPPSESQSSLYKRALNVLPSASALPGLAWIWRWWKVLEIPMANWPGRRSPAPGVRRLPQEWGDHRRMSSEYPKCLALAKWPRSESQVFVT